MGGGILVCMQFPPAGQTKFGVKSVAGVDQYAPRVLNEWEMAPESQRVRLASPKDDAEYGTLGGSPFSSGSLPSAEPVWVMEAQARDANEILEPDEAHRRFGAEFCRARSEAGRNEAVDAYRQSILRWGVSLGAFPRVPDHDIAYARLAQQCAVAVRPTSSMATPVRPSGQVDAPSSDTPKYLIGGAVGAVVGFLAAKHFGKR